MCVKSIEIAVTLGKVVGGRLRIPKIESSSRTGNGVRFINID